MNYYHYSKVKKYFRVDHLINIRNTVLSLLIDSNSAFRITLIRNNGLSAAKTNILSLSLASKFILEVDLQATFEHLMRSKRQIDNKHKR